METQNKSISGIIKFSKEIIKTAYKKSNLTKLKSSYFVFHSGDNCSKKILVLLNAKDDKAYQYIKTAVNKGAIGIITDSKINEKKLNIKIPIFVLKKLALCLNSFLEYLYNDPLANKFIIGVTGTDGKTSCVHLLAQSLEYLGKTIGIISSEGNGEYNNLKKNIYTTPPPHILFKYFSEFRKKNIDIIIIECSSQGLDQNRLKNIKFNQSIVTNITKDHLDYHKTLNHYMKSKVKLIDMTSDKIYLNKDCSSTKKIINMFKTKAQIIYYKLDSEINFKNLKLEDNLPARYNLSSIASVLKGMNINSTKISKVFRKLSPVIGRNNCIVTEENIIFHIDYAHTSQSFQTLLEGIKRKYSDSSFNLITIFGCGGNRDIAKRSLMGSIAEKYSNTIILTDDNPRNEEPDKIINDICSGINDKKKIIIISNRKRAIRKAVSIAKKNDIVVLAGKGNEDDIIYGTKIIKHNDLKYLRAVIK
tara:strand:+ start:492 stop:1916 length:1425 start_codon:yes stop_codon:yes gene_type:complete